MTTPRAAAVTAGASPNPPQAATQAVKTRRRRGPVRAIVSIFVWLLMAFSLLLVLVMIVIPIFRGLVPLSVMSGSMEPKIPVGSQAYARPIEDLSETKRIQVGDVITYMPNANDSTLITHRVTAITLVSDGSREFTAKGDNNGAADPKPVLEKQIRAVVDYHIPFVGYIAQVFSPEQKSLGIWILAGILTLGGLIYIGMGTHHAMSARKAQEQGSQGPDGVEGVEPTPYSTPIGVEYLEQ